jgi:nickel-dependent lactate racemase
MPLIRLPQLAWYGTKELELPLPDSWQAEVYNMAGFDRPAMKPDEIKVAITNLIGSSPIRELARGKNEVVIIFDDMTRVTRVAELVPFILEELAEAGILDNRIQFICATGAHMACDRLSFVNKLGEAIVARFPVYNHNPFNNCTYVGNTSYGTDIYINAEVMKCDLKIAIGSVVPHPSTGFGGGGKIILPGVSSVETIEHFHRLEAEFKQKYPSKLISGMGVFDDNPLRLNIEEATALAGLDVKIDCIVNSSGETVAIFAGAPKPTWAAAVSEAKAHYLTPETKGEGIVIANTFAKANEAIMIGLNTAFSAVGDNGGDVVLIANAPGGQVTHYLMSDFGKTTSGKLKLLAKIPQNVNHVIIYTEYSDIAGRGNIEESAKVLFVSNWDDALQALQQFHRAETKVAVLPDGEIQYFLSQIEERI